MSWYLQTSLTGGGPSGSGGAGAVIQGVMDAQFNPTDLNTSRTFSPNYSDAGGGAETDVIIQGASIDGAFNTLGYAYCDSVYTGGAERCDQHYIVIDTDESWGTTPEARVFCHEIGHTVGLTHGPECAGPALSSGDSSLGCMRTLPLTSDTTLGTFMTGEINRVY